MKVRNGVRYYFFWAINPLAILEVYRESRKVILSVYGHVFQFYIPRDKLGQVYYITSRAIVNPMDYISIYTKKGPSYIGFQLDSEVHSVVTWINILLGFKVVVGEYIFINFFENWLLKENNMVRILSYLEI